jgi:hypothetical protein
MNDAMRRIEIARTKCLQARLNARRESAKIAHALHFIVGKLDAEMMFEPGEHFERLQTVDSEFFEKIVVWRERFARNIEMLCSEIQHFVGGLVDGSQEFSFSATILTCKQRSRPIRLSAFTADTAARPNFPRICASLPSLRGA